MKKSLGFGFLFHDLFFCLAQATGGFRFVNPIVDRPFLVPFNTL